MGRRGRRQGNSAGTAFGSAGNNTVTLREEKTGRRDQSSNPKKNKNKSNTGVSVKATDMLKIEHLEWCAVWAARDAKIPSLAAFYGHRLAFIRESLGVRPNPALFQCQRCETILQRDINCTVRTRKNKAKAQQISNVKPYPTPNYVVYTCHFCSHRNLKKETTRQKMKETSHSKTETTPKSTSAESDSREPVGAEKAVGCRDEDYMKHESALSKISAVSSEIPTTEGHAMNIFASEIKMTLNPTPFESNSQEPVGAEMIVGGRDEVKIRPESALHPAHAISSDIPTTNRTATPIARIEHVKEIRPSETKMAPNETPLESNSPKPVGLAEVSGGKDKVKEPDESVVSPALVVSREIPITNAPATPAVRTRLTLLDANKRKRKKSTAKKPAEPENSSAPTDAEKTIGKLSRRKRKSWTSLEEIAGSIDRAKSRNIYNSPIPFSL